MDNVLNKIEKTDNCWIWRGETSSKGYGTAYLKGKKYRAHRLLYEMFVGQIPKNLEIDHLCRNRACVNPAHLETVTHTENVRRSLPYRVLKPKCKNGHDLVGDNLSKSFKGYGRICRTCKNQRQLAYLEKKKAHQ